MQSAALPALPTNGPEIRPTNILFIVNNDIPQSLADATDYASRRGLTLNVLAFNFGAYGVKTAVPTMTDLSTAGTYSCQTAGPQLGLSVIAAVNSYLVANDSDMVLCSTYTPSGASGVNIGGISGMIIPFPPALAASKWWTANGIAAMYSAGGGGYFNISLSDPKDTLMSYQLAFGRANWLYLPKNNGSLLVVPHGRLGACQINGVLGPAEILCYPQCCISALAAESQNNAGKLHLLTDNLSYSIISSTDNAKAYNWAVRNRFSLLNMGVDVPFSGTDGGSGVGFDTLLSSNIGSVFAYSFAQIFNFTNSSGWQYLKMPYLANFSVAPGGWWFAWTSSAFCTGLDFLGRGGGAAVCTVSEPYAQNLPRPELLFIALTGLKSTLAAAVFVAGTNLPTTVYGDPLYRPYKSTTLVSA